MKNFRDVTINIYHISVFRSVDLKQEMQWNFAQNDSFMFLDTEMCQATLFFFITEYHTNLMMVSPPIVRLLFYSCRNATMMGYQALLKWFQIRTEVPRLWTTGNTALHAQLLSKQSVSLVCSNELESIITKIKMDIKNDLKNASASNQSKNRTKKQFQRQWGKESLLNIQITDIRKRSDARHTREFFHYFYFL